MSFFPTANPVSSGAPHSTEQGQTHQHILAIIPHQHGNPNPAPVAANRRHFRWALRRHDDIDPSSFFKAFEYYDKQTGHADYEALIPEPQLGRMLRRSLAREYRSWRVNTAEIF
ncbi:hypothetical protein BGZ99_001978 [Dissophora globulifera]|uniref:Uncharacterized protein n=1 Tax=Dissophora globulifera TaxID=979702 RepID=A0A9P6RQX7_9FUNG|nr:hypothetical protein BGZ99_001978 [Dissophora globulifera]